MQHQHAAPETAAQAAPWIRPKLRIGPVDDPLEREADSLADAVMTDVAAARAGDGSTMGSFAAAPVKAGHGDAKPAVAPRGAGRPPVVQRKTCACSGTCASCRSSATSAADLFEEEADRVADLVVSDRSPTSAMHARGGPAVQRQSAVEEEKTTLPPVGAAVGAILVEDEDLRAGNIHRKPARGGVPTAAGLSRAAAAVARPGRPLTWAERAYFEPRFGRDLSAIRLHDGAEAQAAATGIGARAYACNQNIAFAPGQYAPGTREGRRLIAHELAHTVQQAEGAAPAVQRQEQAEESGGSMPRAEEIALSRSSPGTAEAQTSPPAISLANFAIDEAEPKALHRALLLEVAQLIREDIPFGMRVRVVGHASAPGTEPHNLQLSRRRAEAVAALLREAGVSAVTVGFSGEVAPVAPNDTVGGRSRNRRVDIHLEPVPGPVPRGVTPEQEEDGTDDDTEREDDTDEDRPPPRREPPPRRDRDLCEKYPLLCGLIPPVLPPLPPLLPVLCIVAPELCVLAPCILAPELCGIGPPDVPDRPDRPQEPEEPEEEPEPPRVIFGRVRAVNTPPEMGDRIPDQGTVSVGARVENYDASMGPIRIGRNGASASAGEFTVDGGISATITGSVVLGVEGTSQTTIVTGARRLRLSAHLGTDEIGRSDPFAVAGIMFDMTTRRSPTSGGEVVDATGAALIAQMSWSTDAAGGIGALGEMEYGERVEVLREEGGMVGSGLGIHGFYIPPTIPRDDTHSTPQTLLQSEGVQEIQQTHDVVDWRVGDDYDGERRIGGDIPVKNSGFRIDRVVEPDPGRPGCLRFVTDKRGAAGTADGVRSGAGSGRARMVVELPCPGGPTGGGRRRLPGPGGTGPSPSRLSLPQPYLGPLPTGATPFSYVSGVSPDASVGAPVILVIAFHSETVAPPPRRELFRSPIPCLVTDTSPTHITVTTYPAPFNLAPLGFQPTVMPPRRRISIPRILLR